MSVTLRVSNQVNTIQAFRNDWKCTCFPHSYHISTLSSRAPLWLWQHKQMHPAVVAQHGCTIPFISKKALKRAFSSGRLRMFEGQGQKGIKRAPALYCGAPSRRKSWYIYSEESSLHHVSQIFFHMVCSPFLCYYLVVWILFVASSFFSCLLVYHSRIWDYWSGLKLSLKLTFYHSLLFSSLLFSSLLFSSLLLRRSGFIL